MSERYNYDANTRKKYVTTLKIDEDKRKLISTPKSAVITVSSGVFMFTCKYVSKAHYIVHESNEAPLSGRDGWQAAAG